MNTGAESISNAFADDVNLRKRIFDAINEIPRFAPLFVDIAKYQLAHHQSSVVNGQEHDTVEQPSKKRKLEEGAATNGSHLQHPRTVILEARDISFTLPQRKKLHLCIVQYGHDFNAPTTKFGLCGSNPATSQVEFEYPLSTFAYALRVAVPEKAQKQYNFCLLSSQSPPSSNNPGAGEAVIWTVNYGPLKSCQVFSENLKGLVGSEDILENALDAVLRRGGNKLVYPNEVEFVSALVESHRKSDKAYHVKAFRGSKDGYLFFLESGIFFGFKKPLAFFSFEEIDSVSYTAVLQRTFNLIIVVRVLNNNEQQEIEFSMIDQADFAGIDAYVKKHQLQNASMAEARRAKKFNVNNPKMDAAETENNDGQTELQKAEQELEDEEDEMEEDYDPGSEGESEGSGSDEDDDEYDYGPKSKGKDLVKDELGSEAEDVEITEDEAADDDEADEEELEAETQNQLTDKVESNPPKQPVRTPLPVHTHTPAPGYGVPDVDDEDQL